jgi:hypothetical protein
LTAVIFTLFHHVLIAIFYISLINEPTLFLIYVTNNPKNVYIKRSAHTEHAVEISNYNWLVCLTTLSVVRIRAVYVLMDGRVV